MSTLPAPVVASLEALGAEYEVVACDPAFADTAAFCERYGFPTSQSANAILVASKKEPRLFALCMALATTRLDVNRKVRSILGGPKLSFASPEDTVARTGMMIGGVTPFGLPADLPLLVDAAVMACPWVIVGSGDRAAKIKIAPECLGRLPSAQIVAGLAAS